MSAIRPPLLLFATLLAAGGVLAARAQQNVDMEQIFWCRDGENGGLTQAECADARELILLNCTVCHTFVRIARAQKTEAEWNATLSRHRQRVVNLSDEQFARVRQYLISHFNPGHPQPELPPELLQLGNRLHGPAAGPS
jgi:hypothetical protein